MVQRERACNADPSCSNVIMSFRSSRRLLDANRRVDAHNLDLQYVLGNMSPYPLLEQLAHTRLRGVYVALVSDREDSTAGCHGWDGSVHEDAAEQG